MQDRRDRSTVADALAFIADGACDVAFLDANLNGDHVDDVAAALTRKGIPFAFATGHGSDGLPPAFREAPVMVKPFKRDQVLAVLEGIAGRKAAPVVPLRPGSGRESRSP